MPTVLLTVGCRAPTEKRGVYSPGRERQRAQVERNDDSDSEVCLPATAAERSGNTSKGFGDVYMKTDSRIWP